ncbi:hypothetical protein Q5H92_22845 [Hymenobacter sp. M29]|uniref:LamG domain-containing protein n=1 Tax=Hymenobacter mellowenesis TaxID=3063995 RepID=A0ABT9AH72_9BACT|nr:hypothetical protein [Hymenobacter sp. M29]MDO7849220.1 hypothetical protein [Hymenobacter sp. M29]
MSKAFEGHNRPFPSTVIAPPVGAGHSTYAYFAGSALQFPTLPNAKVMAGFIKRPNTGSGYGFDNRPAGSGYFLSGDHPNFLIQSDGVSIDTHAPFSDELWHMFYFEAVTNFISPKLLARNAGDEFLALTNLADLRVYDRVWTPAEKAAASGNGTLPTDSSVIARYDFVGMTGVLIPDVSGNGRDITVTGAAGVLYTNG